MELVAVPDIEVQLNGMGASAEYCLPIRDGASASGMTEMNSCFEGESFAT
jgi:hypothetical protein